MVHALHERAKQFYEHYGFQESPQHPMPLMLRLSTVKAIRAGVKILAAHLEAGRPAESMEPEYLAQTAWPWDSA